MVLIYWNASLCISFWIVSIDMSSQLLIFIYNIWCGIYPIKNFFISVVTVFVLRLFDFNLLIISSKALLLNYKFDNYFNDFTDNLDVCVKSEFWLFYFFPSLWVFFFCIFACLIMFENCWHCEFCFVPCWIVSHF